MARMPAKGDVKAQRPLTRRGGRTEPGDMWLEPGGAPVQPGGKALVLSHKRYEKELLRLQTELVYMQESIVSNRQRLVVLFEGRDTAGKDGVIKRIIAYLNPRTCRVVALPAPTERERTQWYFQRYAAQLPAAGEIVLFDRSWYNRAGVEHVMGFCTDAEYEEFLRFCPLFEQALLNDGIMLVKYWLSVSDSEQERRFEKRLSDPRKRWKFSPTDLQARARWVDYAEAKDRMFARTDTELSPWYVVEADDKRTARLNLISHLLSLIRYEHREELESVRLPPRQRREYVRPPKATERLVPTRYTVRSDR
jgi:polyphosphate kinase